MLKFNNNHIFTGYLKQLLSSFNLPTYRIYKRDYADYFEKYGKESPEILPTVTSADTLTYNGRVWRFPYLKDGGVMEYKYSGDALSAAGEIEKGACEWVRADNYFEDKKTQNTTKRLKIKNNIYDSYTHEYLGDYLRFLRDYRGVDLMPLYNCFSNRVCQTLTLGKTSVVKVETTTTADDGTKTQAEKTVYDWLFNATDKHYKIYMIPVKLFQEYTIAIDCGSAVEICCGLYGKYQDETSSVAEKLPQATYRKYGRLSFKRPILYSPLKNLYVGLEAAELSEVAAREKDLVMFLKLPAHNGSSIAVLEGDYRGYNDRYTKIIAVGNAKKLTEVKNHTVTNFMDEATGAIVSEADYSDRKFKPITFLSLLAYNTGVNYPFADKLIEYLSGNAITPLDDVPDDIARVQDVVYDATDGKIDGVEGAWDERIRPIMYDFMQNYIPKIGVTQELNYDVLGYVDKTLENRFCALSKKTNGGKATYEVASATIANVDLYPEIYLAAKGD